MFVRKDSKKPVLPGVAFCLAAALALSGCANLDPGDGADLPVSDLSPSVTEHEHEVRRGETLYGISKRYNTPLATLIAANDIAPPYMIKTGEVLRIPTGASATKILPSPERPPAADGPWQKQASLVEETPQAEPEVDVRHHVVEYGETLADIGNRYGLGIADLVAVNTIDAPYEVEVGQTLTIPPSEEALNRQAQKIAETRRLLALEDVPAPPLSTSGFLLPVEGEITKSFEESRAEKARGESGSLSIAADRGTPIKATNNGVVAFTGQVLDRYGMMVVLRHAEGFTSLYAHNDKLLVEEGDFVYRGQVIAHVGVSGFVTESQLRFEIRRNLEPIDPMTVVGRRPVYPAASSAIASGN